MIVADRCRLAEPVVAFRAGANGYFVDIPSCDVFIRSLELVTLGQRADAFLSFVLGPEGAQLGEQPAKNQAVPSAPAGDIIGPQLSNREKSILRCLVEGHSNKSIARKFDIGWFLQAMHKYRRLRGEVLMASFFIQVCALITPLFFQVVIDKVLVHRGLTTLDVLAFGLITVSVFETLLTALRTYVFAHTTKSGKSGHRCHSP